MESRTAGKGLGGKRGLLDVILLTGLKGNYLEKRSLPFFVILIILSFSYLNLDPDRSLKCGRSNCINHLGKLIPLAPGVWPLLRSFGEPLLEAPSELCTMSN